MEKYVEIKRLSEAAYDEKICALYPDARKNVEGRQDMAIMVKAEQDALAGKCKLLVWREVTDPESPLYKKGYEAALREINTPMKVIVKNEWSPSLCPRCKKDFDEECNDGYYFRATVLKRCNNCGQKLDWTGVY